MSYLGPSVVFLVSFSGLNASFVSPDFSGNEMNSRDAKADLPLNFNAVKFTFPDKCSEKTRTHRDCYFLIFEVPSTTKSLLLPPGFFFFLNVFCNPPDTLSKATELNVPPHLFCCTGVCVRGNFLSILV